MSVGAAAVPGRANLLLPLREGSSCAGFPRRGDASWQGKRLLPGVCPGEEHRDLAAGPAGQALGGFGVVTSLAPSQGPWPSAALPATVPSQLLLSPDRVREAPLARGSFSTSHFALSETIASVKERSHLPRAAPGRLLPWQCWCTPTASCLPRRAGRAPAPI